MTRTADIQVALKRYYHAPEYAIFFEVMDATGARHNGYADAIAMPLWPSRGTDLIGMEIKVSRGDWLREKANPAKAERFAARCDRWYLVTAQRVVLMESEVPDGWGWMELHPEKGLVTMRPAPKLESQPLDRPFFAALCRAAQNFSKEHLDAAIEERLASARRQDEAMLQHRIDEARDCDKRDAEIMAKIRAAVAENDAVRWLTDAEMVAAMVAVMKSGTASTYSGLLSAAEKLEAAAAQIRASHESLALPPAPPKPGRRRAA
jgi:hypothetical protein